jgi:hypothetical protein
LGWIKKYWKRGVTKSWTWARDTQAQVDNVKIIDSCSKWQIDFQCIHIWGGHNK